MNPLSTTLSPAYLWPGRLLPPTGRAMTKFAAVARGDTPNNYGIRLQRYGVDYRQDRQYIDFDMRDALYSASEVSVSSTVSPGFAKEGILVDNQSSAWSSDICPSEFSEQWFAFWFGTRRINSLWLTPRRSNGRAFCFPARIAIFYSAGPENWRPVRELSLNDPGTQDGDILVHLDRTIETDGLLIVAKQLRVDDFGYYYLQIAGAKAGYRTYLDEAAAETAARFLPNRVFFLGTSQMSIKSHRRSTPEGMTNSRPRF